MKFTYTYRSSDGERHMAEIEAESRDAAFAKIRTELGIKPIKVTAVEGESGAGRAASVSAAPRGVCAHLKRGRFMCYTNRVMPNGIIQLESRIDKNI